MTLIIGIEDIKKGLVKAVSSHFKEDPVRPFEQQDKHVELNFEIDNATLILMNSCKDELNFESTRENI